MRTLNYIESVTARWDQHKKIVLRFLVVFFVILAVPLDWKFYREIITTDLTRFNFYDLLQLTRYQPQFFGAEGYYNWLIAAIIAAGGTLLWNLSGKWDLQYNELYYWLRVLLRYRLAFALVAYGLIKLFPLQMPYPSLSNLHTNYGDYLPWKVYFHTLGIVPGYESFLGAVEITAGVLLLFRKTATFGSGIILGFTGNVFAANIAYNGGEQQFSAYLLLMAIVIFAYDAPRLFRLLVQARFTKANRFNPNYNQPALKLFRVVARSAAFVLLLILSIATYANYRKEPYKIPAEPGLKGAYGFYNVQEFRLNNRSIPYSQTDPDRWQNVVFEKWATASFQIARPVHIDHDRGGRYHENGEDRNFESAGVAGRHYYSYTIDSLNHTLHLTNKNKNHKGEQYRLQYHFPNDSVIVLSGINEKNDSIYAELSRISKKYMLQEGRRKRVKL